MKTLANVLGAVGLLWLAYFWMAVFMYPRVRFATPNLNGVVSLTMGSAALCAFAGKVVSKRWWAGILLALLTLIVIYARVRL
jgi:hypothetical protein